MKHKEMWPTQKTTSMYLKVTKICEDLVYFMFQIFTVGIGNWSFEAT